MKWSFSPRIVWSRRAEEAAEEERRRMKAAEAEATERIRQMALAEQKKKVC